MRTPEQQLNEVAYRNMEDALNSAYPHGQFVAFMGGEIIADAPDFDNLQFKLKSAGRNPYQAFIVQAGHHYPRKAIIFM